MKHVKRFNQYLQEKDYSDTEREELAGKGQTLPDGSFPIKNKADLENAIKAYGRAKNQSAAAKHIAKRAKELGAEDLIPKTDDFQKSLNEAFSVTTTGADSLGLVAAKILAIRDQSHIFHWQTSSFAEHEAFGSFYDDYLEAVDDLVEMIMGIKGRPTFGQFSIQLQDYSVEGITQFFDQAYLVFKNDLRSAVDESIYEEIFDQARIIVGLLDKLKYVISLK